MMFGSPFYLADDDYFVTDPRIAYRQRQRAAAEEARRQAELEHFYRMEEAKRQRQQQETQRRRQLLERRIAEEQYRHSYNEAMRRDLGRRAVQSIAAQDNYHLPMQDANDEPSFRVVRGRDGRLYRVQVDQGSREMSNPNRRAPPTAVDDTSLPSHEQRTEAHHQRENKTAIDESVIPSLARPLRRKSSKPEPRRTEPRKTKMTILVEDASDSEDEGDELNSPWRHRRPAPGHWIEPVHGYTGH